MKISRVFKRRVSTPVVICAAVSAAIAVGSARGAATSCPVVNASIPVGLTMRLTPIEVTQTALAAMATHDPYGCVESIRAVPSVRDLASYEPGIGRPGPAFPDVGALWLVRGKGLFVATHGYPGNARMRARSGYFVILDSTGAVVGMGLP